MPIRFNAWRIIGADGVNEVGRLGLSYSDFLYTPLNFIAAANLVVCTGADEITEALVNSAHRGWTRSARQWRKQFADIFVIWSRGGPLHKPGDQFGSIAKRARYGFSVGRSG